jgi:hypothetical protein
VVDGIPLKIDLAAVWSPVFSPESDKIMVKGIGSGANESQYCRHVFNLSG